MDRIVKKKRRRKTSPKYCGKEALNLANPAEEIRKRKGRRIN